MMPGDDYIDLFLKLDSSIEHDLPCRDHVWGRCKVLKIATLFRPLNLAAYIALSC